MMFQIKQERNSLRQKIMDCVYYDVRNGNNKNNISNDGMNNIGCNSDNSDDCNNSINNDCDCNSGDSNGNSNDKNDNISDGVSKNDENKKRIDDANNDVCSGDSVALSNDVVVKSINSDDDKSDDNSDNNSDEGNTIKGWGNVGCSVDTEYEDEKERIGDDTAKSSNNAVGWNSFWN